MLAYTRNQICPSCDMEFISTLLTTFRTSCYPHVLMMSGKGDVCADGQSKDRESGDEHNLCSRQEFAINKVCELSQILCMSVLPLSSGSLITI